MANDIRRLKDEADIMQVINYLGIPVTKRGNAYFILCPQPDHDDTNASNCYFKEGWNNVYCKACLKSTNAIDLITYTTGKSYGEAADLLWELEGKPDWYYERNSRQQKSGFHMTKEEREILGIHSPGRLLLPEKEVFYKEEQMDHHYTYDPAYTHGYLKCKVGHFQYTDFMSERMYVLMVKEKAFEVRRETKKLMNFFKNIQDATGHENVLLQAAIVKIAVCNAIIQRSKEFLYQKKRSS